MQVRLHGRSPHILNKNSKFSGFRGEIARGLPGFSPPLCLCLPFFCSLSIFRAAQSTSLAIVSSIAVKTQNFALRSSWQHRLTIDFERIIGLATPNCTEMCQQPITMLIVSVSNSSPLATSELFHIHISIGLTKFV